MFILTGYVLEYNTSFCSLWMQIDVTVFETFSHPSSVFVRQ